MAHLELWCSLFFVSKMTWLLFVERQKLRTWSQDKSKKPIRRGRCVLDPR